MTHDAASVDVTGDVSSPREELLDTLPRDIEELALIYGVEAHRHMGDADWDEVRDELAAGWPRIRCQRDIEWRQVASRVEAGWHCRSALRGK